eukprot:550291-Lingulodinium_polyedra.AAC.1
MPPQIDSAPKWVTDAKLACSASAAPSAAGPPWSRRPGIFLRGVGKTARNIHIIDAARQQWEERFGTADQHTELY